MSNYITTDWLNLRSEPVIPDDRGSNVLGILPPETVVEPLPAGSLGKWIHVRTLLGNNLVTGFASQLYLEATGKLLQQPDAPLPQRIPLVHLPVKAGKIIRRSEVNGRAFHLQEPVMKTINLQAMQNAALKTAGIHEVVDWLDVEHSARYSPTTSSTYCNIYAYDVAWCCGLYIPRVWWNEKAFNQIESGRVPEIIYEDTVTELNANALTNWFENYGALFGWKRMLDVQSLQQEVNLGSLGIIVAQRINLNRSGHIVAVLPETGLHKAQHNAANNIISPLQSQAGVNNKKYFTGKNWWANPNMFRKFGFWVWQQP